MEAESSFPSSRDYGCDPHKPSSQSRKRVLGGVEGSQCQAKQEARIQGQQFPAPEHGLLPAALFPSQQPPPPAQQTWPEPPSTALGGQQ